MDINASYILIAAAIIVVAAVAWSLWQQRATLTSAGIVQAASTISGLTRLLYDDAVVLVSWLEQTTGAPLPDATPEEIAAVNREKKRLAFDALQRRAEQLRKSNLTPEEVEALNQLLEGVVYAVKVMGGRLPQVHLVDDAPVPGWNISPQEL